MTQRKLLFFHLPAYQRQMKRKIYLCALCACGEDILFFNCATSQKINHFGSDYVEPKSKA
jgi:hypothetical protein